VVNAKTGKLERQIRIGGLPWGAVTGK